MSKTGDSKKLLEAAREDAVPPEARADCLIYAIADAGLDYRSTVTELIKEADAGRKLKAKAEQDEANPLTPEAYLCTARAGGRLYAVVTNGPGEAYLPCREDDIDGLYRGDIVLVDHKTGRLAGRDGVLPRPGEVVTVQSVPATPGLIVVRHHDQDIVARLPERLGGCDGLPEPGMRVVYDPVRRIVLQVIDTQSDGSELLTDVAVLDKVTPGQLGAAHPVLEQMLFRAKMWVEHPEWVRRMNARSRMSYMFIGPTGGGKSTHLMVFARKLTDFVEELTGQRVSRLVLADASDFYSSLFGETEARIRQWFSSLKKLGRTKLRTRDGREVVVPLIVVFEEVEALVRARGEFGGSSHLFDRPLALILQCLSSLADELDIPVLFCCTTNRHDLVDAAARRRLGVRQVLLGTLSAGQAASVLATKITPDMKLRGERGSRELARQDLINQVTSYLYGPDPDQGIADVQFANSQRRLLCRRDVVTGSMIDDAVGTAIDDCLIQSAEVGELLGIDGEGIIRGLHAQFVSLAETLRPHNLREYCPEWFAEETNHVTSVRSLVRRARRPRAVMMR